MILEFTIDYGEGEKKIVPPEESSYTFGVVNESFESFQDRLQKSLVKKSKKKKADDTRRKKK